VKPAPGSQEHRSEEGGHASSEAQTAPLSAGMTMSAEVEAIQQEINMLNHQLQALYQELGNMQS
jgi:hypothetical protein